MKKLLTVILFGVALSAPAMAADFRIELGDSYWPGTDRSYRTYRDDPYGGVYGDYNRPRRKRPYVNCRKTILTVTEAEYCAERALRRRNRSN